MRLYYAPLESVTGYPLRNTHQEFFDGIDKYFTPFVSANEAGKFTGREGRDIAPENNQGIPLVPQLLSKNTEHILWAIDTMYDLGYREINLNLGCPSGTVTAKGKGAGMLRDTMELDWFFEELFQRVEKAGYKILTEGEVWGTSAEEDGARETESEKMALSDIADEKKYSGGKAVAISVKTRLGISDIREAEELVKVYNRYPISELTVHARVLKDMYRNPVSIEGFSVFYENAKLPLVYNGDINNVEDYKQLCARFPNIRAVMLGRGIVGNPALAREIRGGEGLKREELKSYLNLLLENYRAEISGERNILFKMKENWGYLAKSFRGIEKYQKELRKAASLVEYKAAVRRIFAECTLEG